MARYRSLAQSMIELVVGLTVMIPVLLFLLDIGSLTLATVINGDLAKHAARAAASASNGTAAQAATNSTLVNFGTSGIITRAQLAYFDYWDPTTRRVIGGAGLPSGFPAAQPGQVMVATTVTVKLPVQLPLLPATHNFSAYSVQPIVAIKTNMP